MMGKILFPVNGISYMSIQSVIICCLDVQMM